MGWRIPGSVPGGPKVIIPQQEGRVAPASSPFGEDSELLRKLSPPPQPLFISGTDDAPKRRRRIDSAHCPPATATLPTNTKTLKARFHYFIDCNNQ